MSTNIISNIKNHANRLRNKPAIIFAEAKQNSIINFDELYQRILNLAAHLTSLNLYQQRVLIIVPAGIDFVVSFLACLSAGAIGVPIPVPSILNFSKIMPLISAIKNNTRGNTLLTNTKMISLSGEFLKNLEELQLNIINLNEINLNDNQNFQSRLNDISHIQYSSGSTSSAKGVISTQQNLTTVLGACAKKWKIKEDCISVSWAPHSHVYGLVCGILLPLFKGNTAIIMSPEDFIRNPLSWLRLFSEYKANYGGCPNFGYDLCVKQYSKDPTPFKGLDLTSWHAAINGGDLVQKQTLVNFSQTFAAYGFNEKSFCSAYGMSENTGLITSTNPQQKIKSILLPTAETQVKRNIVSSGTPIPSLTMVIVNPETCVPVPDGNIGEIWISGPTLSWGYWEKEAETKDSFSQKIKGETNASYFRTGDLGFMQNNELFITGRFKELICAYGQKFYPQDLERIVSQSHPNLGLSINAIFSCIVKGQEQIILVQEIANDQPEAEFPILAKSIRIKLGKELGIDLYHIMFVNQGTIPKTNSGKLQRLLCKRNYEKGELNYIYEERK